MSEWGKQKAASDEPPSTQAEQVYLAIGIACLAGAIAVFLVDVAVPIQMPLGLYPILVGLALGGGCAWQIGAGRREHQVETQRTRAQLAELTSAVQDVQAQFAESGPARPRLAASCRVPAIYTSRAGRGDTLGIQVGTVDALTDPSGLALQRAREDGIEEGFDIGLKVQLAERGVPSIPRPRRPRLTGDS